MHRTALHAWVISKTSPVERRTRTPAKQRGAKREWQEEPLNISGVLARRVRVCRYEGVWVIPPMYFSIGGHIREIKTRATCVRACTCARCRLLTCLGVHRAQTGFVTRFREIVFWIQMTIDERGRPVSWQSEQLVRLSFIRNFELRLYQKKKGTQRISH